MSNRNTTAVGVALALILGFYPIHADDHPYGIVPKEHDVRVASETDLNTWHLRFHNKAEFVSALSQSGFETLASGETDVAYYVFFRIKPDILIFAYCCKKEEKSNGGFDLTGPGGSYAMFDSSVSLTPVMLLDIHVQSNPVTFASPSGSGVRTPGLNTGLQGFAARIHHDYAGPLILKFQLWTEGKDKVRSVASPTINWIAAS
jgi:hypothetical protein